MKDAKKRFKGFVFIQYAALGVWAPYLPVYLYDKNFSGIQIGLLLGTLPIITIIAQPAWGFLSDVLRTRRKLLIISSLGATIAVLGLGSANAFHYAFLWALSFSVFWAPLTSVSTAMLLDLLESSGEVDKFSLVRLWGSIGFAITSFLVGSLFLNQLSDYFTWLTAGLFFLLVGFSLRLPEKRGFIPYPQGKPGQILAGNPGLLIYLIASIFIGATLGVYNNYQALFLQSLNAQDWLVGLTVSLQALVEVPLMAMVPYFLKHLPPRRIILAGGILLPLRWAFYFFVQRPGWIAPSQVIHGVAIISFSVIGVAYIDQLISPTWRATGLTIQRLEPSTALTSNFPVRSPSLRSRRTRPARIQPGSHRCRLC
jgi:MFS transporter, PPP family, 3-phenylpropionic acid transporter